MLNESFPRTMNYLQRTLALGAVALLAGCGEGSPAGPSEEPPAPEPLPQIGSPVSCTVRLVGGLTCAAAARPASLAANLLVGGRGEHVRLTTGGNPIHPAGMLVGGQGQHVRLATAGEPTHSAGVWSVKVSVENLMERAMGTANGMTPEAVGVRVVLVEPPSNGVTVANAAGKATFTAPNQPYFKYTGAADLSSDQVLQPKEVSEEREWRFNLNGATSFTFKALVYTVAPAEDRPFQWTIPLSVPKVADDWVLASVAFGGGALVAASVERSLLRSTDGGATWSVVADGGTENLQDMASNGNTWVAVGMNGTIFRSVDGGVRWARVPSGTGAPLIGVAVRGNTWVASAGGSGRAEKLLRSTDDGATWSPVSSGSESAIQSVESSGTTWIGVGPQGTILRSTDDGVTWSRVPSGVSANLQRVAASGTTWVAVGWDSTILRSTDDGASWGKVDAGTKSLFLSVSGSGKSWLAVGMPGTVLRSIDGGATWFPEPPHDLVPMHSLSDVKATSERGAIAVGPKGMIRRGM